MTDDKQELPPSQIHDDITELYSSARLPGATYRDYSASRREAREHFRQILIEEQANQPQKENPAPEPLAEGAGAPERQSENADGPTPMRGQVGDAAPGRKHVSAEERAFSSRPQWLAQEPVREAGPQAETLLRATARVASRWFALRSFFPQTDEIRLSTAAHFPEQRVPTVLIFSVAGGVGKTTLAAMLGRALAAHGERILLADVTSFGLLPLYFGSHQLKPGTVRTFAPPEGSGDAPLQTITLDADERSLDHGGEDPLLAVLRSQGCGLSRIVIDVQTASNAIAKRLLSLSPIVLVPLLPEMSSIASLSSVEDTFAGDRDSDRPAIEPMYLLNQFDASLPLHVDVREMLQEQLGSRLIPSILRHSPAVSEALAEGMTVMDYAPTSPVVEDYIRLAGWLRSNSAVPPIALRGMRWSER